jgi:hypothetical protein
MLIRCDKEYDTHEKLNFQKIVLQQVEVVVMVCKRADILQMQVSIHGSSNDFFRKKFF